MTKTCKLCVSASNWTLQLRVWSVSQYKCEFRIDSGWVVENTQCFSCYTDAPWWHRNTNKLESKTGRQCLAASAVSCQPTAAEGCVGLRGWRVAELVFPDPVMSWCASFSQDNTTVAQLLCGTQWAEDTRFTNPDITTACGSQSPKPSSSWSRACVSVNEKSRSQDTLMRTSPEESLLLLFGDYLCECDWLVFGNVICIFAREHSTVATVHLLRDFLTDEEIKMLLIHSANVY